jgi:hypothetical protein
MEAVEAAQGQMDPRSDSAAQDRRGRQNEWMKKAYSRLSQTLRGPQEEEDA